LREIVRGEADAFVWIGQADLLAQRAIEEGVCGSGLWPRAFVEAGEDDAVAALKAGFEWAPDGDAGMFGRVWRGDHALHDGFGEVSEIGGS
jgi:hypothetical protein